MINFFEKVLSVLNEMKLNQLYYLNTDRRKIDKVVSENVQVRRVTVLSAPLHRSPAQAQTSAPFPDSHPSDM